jgi:hypothetical protein
MFSTNQTDQFELKTKKKRVSYIYLIKIETVTIYICS